MYRGIFWIVGLVNLANNHDYLIKIKTDTQGTIINYDLPLNSKKKNNYTHKRTWNNLSNYLTNNKSFDYYPRGRVEIRDNTCTIFISPVINTEEVIEYLKDEFCLREIGKISVINDNSIHYQNYLNKKMIK